MISVLRHRRDTSFVALPHGKIFPLRLDSVVKVCRENESLHEALGLGAKKLTS